MKTEVIKISADYPEHDRIAQCAKVIRQGGLVIFPTETVYGIAANLQNEGAMARLRKIKQRPADKSFSVLISQKELISNYTSSREPVLYKMIDAFWPGPLTVVVATQEPGKTIGLRMPANKIALNLVREARCTIAAPSANIASVPAPSTCDAALRDLGGLVDMAIDGGPAQIGQESSVVDLSQGKPVILRQGALAQKDIDRVAQKKTVLFVCTGNSCRSVMAEYLLRDMIKDRSDVEVLSAGTGVFLQASASAETVAVLRKRGIDATEHRAQSINSLLLHKSDLILVMTRSHREQVLEWAPEVENRVYQLREFDEFEAHGTDLDIPDPIGRSVEEYEECIGVIEQSLKKVIKLI